MPKRNPAARAGLGVQTHQGDTRATMVLTGELGLTTSLQFRDALAAVEQDRPPLVVIDLRELGFMDSSGRAELIRATNQARAERRRAVLVTGSEPIDRVLAVSGTEQVLETTADPATLDD